MKLPAKRVWQAQEDANPNQREHCDKHPK